MAYALIAMILGTFYLLGLRSGDALENIDLGIPAGAQQHIHVIDVESSSSDPEVPAMPVPVHTLGPYIIESSGSWQSDPNWYGVPGSDDEAYGDSYSDATT